MNAQQLEAWFAAAAPGEWCRYYRGHLATARHRATVDSEIVQLANTARSLGVPQRSVVQEPSSESSKRQYGQGLAHLVQHRIAPDTYEYFIIKSQNTVLW